MASHIHLKQELQDDDRANVLYSPFRSKTLNPSSWTNKMNFWQQYLKETATEKKIVSFDIERLPTLFERKGMVPKCLPTVLEELQRQGMIKPLEDYKKASSWLSWGFSVLVKQPLTWGLGRIVGSPRKQTSTYVWHHVLKQISEEVLALHQASHHPGVTSNLVSYSDLRDMCSSVVKSDLEFSLVLTHLESKRKIQLIDTPKNGVLVKVCEKGKQSVTPAGNLDIQIFDILEGHKKLEKEAESLTSKIDGLTIEARGFVKEGKKPRALHCLRRRKLITKALERRYTMLSNLEEIIHKIDDAQTNDLVVNACESGVAAMKHLNQNLTVDRVEAVMDDAQEALEDSEEISQAMSSSATAEINTQAEEELEMLLKEMAMESHEIMAKNEDVSLPDLSALSLNSPDNLPDVPTHSPSSQSVRPDERKEWQQLPS